MSERKDYIYDPYLPSPMGFGQHPHDPKDPRDPNPWLILFFIAMLFALAYCATQISPTPQQHDSGPEVFRPVFHFQAAIPRLCF